MLGDGWNTDIAIIIAVILNLTLVSISVVLTIHVLLHKSDPKASLLWIALLWFAPLFGAAFYLSFGINRISRRAAKLAEAIDAEYIGVGDCAITPQKNGESKWLGVERLGDHVTSSMRLPGNTIDIIEGVAESHNAMTEAIAEAKKTIMLSTYIFRRNKLGLNLADALVRADRSGVDVKVLLDGVGNGFLRSRVYHRLKRGGVEVQRFSYSIWPWRMPYLNLRNHRKILIIDDKLGFTGSMNIGHVKNLETHFRIRGPVLTQMLKAFDTDWRMSGAEPLPQIFSTQIPESVGGGSARGVLSGPVHQQERLRWILLSAMGAATKRIRIVTPYFVPDRGLLSGLLLASLRGVKVEIILPRKSNYPFVDWASQWQIEDLFKVGCEFYYRKDVFDHSKLLTIDGRWSLIGSSNWDARSFRLNYEFDIECDDRDFAGRLDKIIDHRKAVSKRLSERDFQKQSLPIKLRNSLARLLLPYL